MWLGRVEGIRGLFMPKYRTARLILRLLNRARSQNNHINQFASIKGLRGL